MVRKGGSGENVVRRPETAHHHSRNGKYNITGGYDGGIYAINNIGI